MNKKRNRLEVIRDILKVILERNGKIKPTHILYKSNLSHQMMEDYLGELIGKGFVVQHSVSTGKTYSVTDKGRTYLDKYKAIAEFTDSFGLNE